MEDKKTLTESQKRKKGIVCLIISAFSFAVMSMFISLAGDMPVFQKALFRNLVALALSIVLLIRSKEKFRIKKGSIPGLLARAGFGTFALVCNFYAVTKINIADAMILNKLSPFFAVIASIIILKEVANVRQWLAIVIALIGSLFVVKPEFLFANQGTYDSSHLFPALVGIAGGITAGIAYTFLRKLSLRGERGIVIVAFFSAFSCLSVIPFIIACSSSSASARDLRPARDSSSSRQPMLPALPKRYRSTTIRPSYSLPFWACSSWANSPTH